MPLSVVGAGLGRTGTMSLKLALERVGFGPCYHMKEVFEHLDAHVPAWDRAANGEWVDWDGLFDGYRAGVDLPVAAFYRELSEHDHGPVEGVRVGRAAAVVRREAGDATAVLVVVRCPSL